MAKLRWVELVLPGGNAKIVAKVEVDGPDSLGTLMGQAVIKLIQPNLAAPKPESKGWKIATMYDAAEYDTVYMQTASFMSASVLLENTPVIALVEENHKKVKAARSGIEVATTMPTSPLSGILKP